MRKKPFRELIKWPLLLGGLGGLIIVDVKIYQLFAQVHQWWIYAVITAMITLFLVGVLVLFFLFMWFTDYQNKKIIFSDSANEDLIFLGANGVLGSLNTSTGTGSNIG